MDLIMAGAAVEQLGALDRVVLGFGLVAVETPAHVDGLFECGDCLFAHVTMAVFAVQPGGDMRTVIEVHKVWHLVNRHPIDRLVFLNIFAQFL